MSGDNIFRSALTGDSWWAVGGDNVVTYCFADDFGYGWTEAEKQPFLWAFRAYEAVCNVTFVEVDRPLAEIVENKVTTELARALRMPSLNWNGWHDEPGAGERSGFYDFTANGLNRWLVAHEIGHAIGLEHPHSTWHGTTTFPGVRPNQPNDAGEHGLNGNHTTIMSYRGIAGALGTAGVWAVTPMAFDIAALQAMYGENLATGSGDDTYVLRSGAWRCIWDAGGIDEIAGSKGDDHIDLRPATLALGPGGGGYASYRSAASGGTTIAAGVVIENADAGLGDDRVRGNAADNILRGGGGDDVIFGSSGDDVLIGGTRHDKLYGNSGNDVLKGSGGADILSGGLGNDTLYGNTGNDILNGGVGIDTIFLGNDRARDIVIAGDGDTIFQFCSGKDKIDLSRLDVDWVDISSNGKGWIVTADYNRDAVADLTVTVLGQRPLMSDFIL